MQMSYGDAITVAKVAARVAAKLLLWLTDPPATAAETAKRPDQQFPNQRSRDTVRDVMRPGSPFQQKTIEQQFAETMDVWPSMMGTLLELIKRTEEAGFPRPVARAMVLSQLGIHVQVTLSDLDFPTP